MTDLLTPPVGAQNTADAVALLSAELQSWGFGQDALAWAKSQITSNNSIDQIVYSLRQQPFYQTSIFGRANAARTSAGLGAMTEAQILSYKDYAVGLAQQAGLPQGFVTDNELVTLMGKDVSTSELDARITQGYQAATQAPPDVLDHLQTYYGVDKGGLAAYFLDPNKALPLLQEQFRSAQAGAAATRTGFGTIDQATAMGIAQLGKTEAEMQTGFSDLAKQAQLMTALPGTAEQGISQATQIGAEFAGNAAAQQTIDQRKQQRVAEFSGGYKFAETQGRGVTGLGSVPRNG